LAPVAAQGGIRPDQYTLGPGLKHMPLLAEADKPALLDEQAAIKKAQAKWAGVAAATLPFAAHLLFIPQAVCGTMIATLQAQQAGVDRALADPPRDDFYTKTRARPRRYRPGMIGDDPLAIAADMAALAILRYAAHLEAVVRADERSQGAERRGRGDLRDERLLEAERLIEQMQDAEREAGRELRTLSLRWAAFTGKPDIRQTLAESGSPRPAHEAVEALADDPPPNLAATGIDLELLRGATFLEAEAFVRSVEDGIVDSAEASWTLSRQMSATAVRLEAIRPIADRERYDEIAMGDSIATGESAPEPSQARRLYLRGALARDLGRFADAEGEFLAAADQAEPAAMFELGMIAAERGNAAGADEWFARAALEDDPDALFQLGLEKRRTGNPDEAITLFNRAAAATLPHS
jgi:tetratricopeptide (TPR) repeat protein